MSFRSSELRLIIDSVDGEGRVWHYRTTDSIGTVMSANYFQGAAASITRSGLKLGDIVVVKVVDRLVDPTRTANYTRTVSSLSGVNATLGGGVDGSASASVINYGATNDVKGRADGIIVAGSRNFNSAGAAFTSDDVGKIIQVDGAWGVGIAPMSTTIESVTSATSVVLADAATTTTGIFYLAKLDVATPRSAGSYKVNDILDIVGGTSTATAKAKVLSTKVISATIVSGGSGIGVSTCVLKGTTGGGTRVELSCTVSGGAVTSIDSITNAGHYTTDPTDAANEPCVVNAYYAVAPVVSLTMGVDVASVSVIGNYTVKPSNPLATGAGSLSGATGATFTAIWWNTGTYFYGWDSSAAFTAATNAMIADRAAGGSMTVSVPAGRYLVNAALPLISGCGGGFVGEGSTTTEIIIGADMSGDLFSWSEAWLSTSAGAGQPFGGYAVNLPGDATGPICVGINISGFTTAASRQNAMMFYDRNDYAIIHDVTTRFVNGRSLGIGYRKNKTQAYMRESVLGDLRFFIGGSSGVPVVEISSDSDGDGTNEVTINGCDIYAPAAGGFYVNNANTGTLRHIKVNNLRVEGRENNTQNFTGDLVRVGDTTLTGIVNNVIFSTLSLIDPYNGFAGLRITAQGSASMPYQIRADGVLVLGGVPLGSAISIDAGRLIHVNCLSMNCWGTHVTVGASPLVGSNISINGFGAEQSWTWSIDSSSWRNVSVPARSSGNPLHNDANLNFISLHTADNTKYGGNSRGGSAIDLQFPRSAATQVASGSQSVIVGGSSNTVSGTQSAAIGGLGNTMSGTRTGVIGGQGASDRGRMGGNYYANGAFYNAGDAMISHHVLRVSTSNATPTAMTTDAAAVGTTNIINLSNGTAYAFRVVLVARGESAGDVARYTIEGAIKRGANAAATAMVGSATVTKTHSDAGTASWGTPTATADTTNGGLLITVTGVAATVIRWVARVDLSEVA